MLFITPDGANPNDELVEYARRDRTVLLEKQWIIVEGLTTFGGMVNIKADNCVIRDCEILQGYQSLDEFGNSDAQVGEGSVYVQASNTLIEGNLIAGGSMNGISVQGWGETLISFNLDNASTLEWALVSPHGQVLKTGRKQLLAGEQQLQLDLEDLPSGAYLFSGTAAEGRITQVIIRR